MQDDTTRGQKPRPGTAESDQSDILVAPGGGEILEEPTGYGSLRPLVPDDLPEIQDQAFAECEDAGLWVTDVPYCLNCHTAHVTAYGGGKQKLTVQEYEIVADDCPHCGMTTIHVL